MLWFLIGGKYLQTTLEITAENALDIMPLLILPVGMSYYILNSISYFIDINLRIAKPSNQVPGFRPLPGMVPQAHLRTAGNAALWKFLAETGGKAGGE